MRAKFTGIMPALITPIEKEEKLKKAAVRQLIDFQLGQGVDGFYICGATGEGPALQAKTRMEMAEVAVEHVAGRGCVIDHIGAPNMQDTLALVRHATQTGVDAIASLAPPNIYAYNADELYAYYAAIAAATDLPVMVYATDTIGKQNIVGLMTRLMQIPNVIGAKFTIRDYFLMRQVREVNNGQINLINGPDETLICGLVMGADGGIGSTYNVMPGWYAELYRSFAAKDWETAQAMQYKVNHVIRVLQQFGDGATLKAIKATLELMGYAVGDAAFPARRLGPDERKALKVALAGAGLVIA